MPKATLLRMRYLRDRGCRAVGDNRAASLRLLFKGLLLTRAICDCRMHSARMHLRGAYGARACCDMHDTSQGGAPRCIARAKGGLNSKMHAVCDDTLTKCGVTEQLPQCIKIRGHISGIGFVDVHIRHCVTGHDSLWITQPAHHVGRRIPQHASDVDAPPDLDERRPDHPHRTVNSRNQVARSATELTNQRHAMAGVAHAARHGFAAMVIAT
jgi:hypothetical protein